MNKNIKKVATVILATNVLASTIISTLPVGTQAATVAPTSITEVREAVAGLFNKVSFPDNTSYEYLKESTTQAMINEARTKLNNCSDITPTEKNSLNNRINLVEQQLAVSMNFTLDKNFDVTKDNITHIYNLPSNNLLPANFYLRSRLYFFDANHNNIGLMSTTSLISDGVSAPFRPDILPNAKDVKYIQYSYSVYSGTFNCQLSNFTKEISVDAANAVDSLFIDGDSSKGIREDLSQADIDKAQTVINTITDATQKEDLQTELDKAQTELNEKNSNVINDEAKAAIDALFIDNNPANHIKPTTDQVAIDAAKAKVDKVTDLAVKADLNAEIAKAQAELDAANTEKAREAAATVAVNDLFINDNSANHIKPTTDQAKVVAAQAKVNTVTDPTKRAELQVLVDKAQNELNTKKAVDDATASVNALFADAPTNSVLKDSTTQAMIDAAKAKVDALPATTPEKTGLVTDVAKANTQFNRIAPTTIGGLTTDSTNVSGNGEPNSTIVIQNGATTIASGKVGSDGNYNFTISKQPALATITATVTKASNGKTASASTIVVAIAKDYKLTAKDYKTGDTSLTGTYGANIAKVRLFVNGTLIVQGTTSNGNYTFANIAKFITKPTDKVEVVGVDSGYVERARVTVKVTGDPVYDYNLTANDYTLGGTTITGKYGKDVSKVRLWVNDTVVGQATTNADGTYSIINVPSWVKLSTDKVEVVGVNAAYKEVARKTVVTKGASILDTSLTPKTYTKGDANLTGTFGKDISKVRLWVNGTLVKQATTNGSMFTVSDIASFITSKDDKVEVVGVNAQYNEVNRVTVPTTGFSTLDNALTAPSVYLLNSNTSNIIGTYGSNVAKVRLFVNGVVVKQAVTTAGNYSLNGIADFIKQTTDVVEVVAVDSQYKEVNRKTISVQNNPVIKDYNLTMDKASYLIGDKTITGSYGKDISFVRLAIDGVNVKTASLNNGIFTLNGVDGSVKDGTHLVEIVASDAGYKEVKRITVTVK
ncbi:toxin Cry1Ac domain D-VI-related protein [Listeria rustica]|uniref:Bacterial Ig domain-containing protein n=1 Tax=Listeria rustica TaxID=2713503 RepID=A0A7W1T847_9LIST|nr:immunoglobulin-like domain-containing protein [Listeria rustica]MBA3927164.1 hypothetical protein [Listeria rustica]